MTKENWKDIEGYEGIYQVSDRGRVKSLNYNHTGKEKILKTRKVKERYLHVCLWKDGEYKFCFVHRLVAQAFIPNPKNYPIINHKDENPSNNCVGNLEWCSSEYNNNYGTKIERFIKSKSRPVKCVETGEVFSSIKEAHEKTGILAGNISSCANNTKWRHTARRFHWQFV